MGKNRNKIIGWAVAVVLVACALVGWRMWPQTAEKSASQASRSQADSLDLAVWLGELFNQARAQDGPETLSGTVADTTGQPLSGVLVAVRRENADPGGLDRFAVTDSAGHFTIPGLARGLYRVRVAGPKLLESEVRRVVVPGEALALVVFRRVTVAGQVLDDGKPVAGASVEIGGEVVMQETESGSDGRFTFSDLPEGSYVVSAHKKARAKVVTVERFGAGPFPDVTIALGEAAVLSGTVSSAADQAPVVGARLVLRPRAGSGGARHTITDDQGTFLIEGLAIGDWSLSVVASEFLSPGPRLISMNKSGLFRAQLVLTRGGVVSGRVLSPTGDPVRGAQVSLVGKNVAGKRVQVSAATRLGQLARSSGVAIVTGRDARARLLPVGELGVLLGPLPFAPPEGAVAARALSADENSDAAFLQVRSGFETDADGRFRIVGVPGGRFVAHAALTGTAGGQSPPLQLHTGVHKESVLIKLRQGVRVWGVVRDENGLGVLATEITARRDGEIIEIAFSDDEGRYSLEPALGAIELRARAPGHAASTRIVRLAERDGGGEREESFVLTAANLTIEGRVVDANRQPVVGAQVLAVGKKGSGRGHKRSSRSDADGVFLLRGLAKGSYRVHAKHEAFLPSLTVDLKSGDRAVLLTVRFGGGVAGTISDAHSKAPIEYAVVVAEGPEGNKLTKTFATAEFSLTPLVAGTWQLRVSADGYAPAVSQVIVPVGRAPAAITKRDVRVELVRGATVGGTVVDSHGQVVSGATVKSGVARATTDQEGRFLLRSVAPGDVFVSASHPKAGSGQKKVPLRSGDEVLTLQIDLQDE